MPQVASFLLERVRETIELLESLGADRSQRAGLPEGDVKRLLEAGARVYAPDRVGRRLAEARRREKRAQRVSQDLEKRAGTGIQTLRRKPVFHTPNVFP